jgi:hypothetical protein
MAKDCALGLRIISQVKSPCYCETLKITDAAVVRNCGRVQGVGRAVRPAPIIRFVVATPDRTRGLNLAITSVGPMKGELVSVLQGMHTATRLLTRFDM